METALFIKIIISIRSSFLLLKWDDALLFTKKVKHLLRTDMAIPVALCNAWSLVRGTVLSTHLNGQWLSGLRGSLDLGNRLAQGKAFALANPCAVAGGAFALTLMGISARNAYQLKFVQERREKSATRGEALVNDIRIAFTAKPNSPVAATRDDTANVTLYSLRPDQRVSNAQATLIEIFAGPQPIGSTFNQLTGEAATATLPVRQALDQLKLLLEDRQRFSDSLLSGIKHQFEQEIRRLDDFLAPIALEDSICGTQALGLRRFLACEVLGGNELPSPLAPITSGAALNAKILLVQQRVQAEATPVTIPPINLPTLGNDTFSALTAAQQARAKYLDYVMQDQLDKGFYPDLWLYCLAVVTATNNLENPGQLTVEVQTLRQTLPRNQNELETLKAHDLQTKMSDIERAILNVERKRKTNAGDSSLKRALPMLSDPLKAALNPANAYTTAVNEVLEAIKREASQLRSEVGSSSSSLRVINACQTELANFVPDPLTLVDAVDEKGEWLFSTTIHNLVYRLRSMQAHCSKLREGESRGLLKAPLEEFFGENGEKGFWPSLTVFRSHALSIEEHQKLDRRLCRDNGRVIHEADQSWRLEDNAELSGILKNIAGPLVDKALSDLSTLRQSAQQQKKPLEAAYRAWIWAPAVIGLFGGALALGLSRPDLIQGIHGRIFQQLSAFRT